MRQEDHRNLAFLAQPAEQLHPVHPRHLDVEDGEIRGIFDERLQRDLAVGIETRDESLRLERDRHRCQDIAVVVDQRDRNRHCLRHLVHKLPAAILRP